MALANFYPSFFVKSANKEIDWDTDAIHAALVSASYTYSDAHDYWDDVVANEIPNGNGYTTNGVALTGLSTPNVVAANSWGAAWASNTPYKAGTLVRPTTGNGRIYRAQADGTSGGTEPTWPTVIGDEVTDSGVTWTCIGSKAVVYPFNDPTWTNITATFRYVVFVDRTPSTNATRPLIGIIDYGSAQSVTNANLTIDALATGAFVVLLP